LRPQAARKACRQLAPAGGLDHRNHVGRPPPEKEARHQLRSKRNADAREFCRGHRRGNALAVDPLQSKMITLAPARSPPGVVDAVPQRIDVAS
jgi:hypothetical protein